MVLLMLAMLLAQQDDAAATQAIATFETNFQKIKDSQGRVALIGQLAGTKHEKVVSKLGSLLTDPDHALRTAAANGLASYNGAPPDLKKTAGHALVSALSSGANNRDPDMMAMILTAIGVLQEESTGNALKPHFEDKDIKIAGAAVTAAGALKSKAMIDPLIELLRECEKQSKPPNSGSSTSGKTVKVPRTKGGGGGGSSGQPDPEATKRDRAANLLAIIQSALQAATGQGLSASDEWEKWWSRNRATFTPSK
jgi:HEAT repeat protein